jgi:hypothetical protein
VLRNNAGSGLPIISPTGLTQPSKDHTTFGDISFTPRVLLHETQDFSLKAEVAALVPTGNQPLAGKTALTPAVSFWNNFAGGWVIRGGIGDFIPLGGGGSDTLISQLAIGQTLTDHDVPLFGDFTWVPPGHLLGHRDGLAELANAEGEEGQADGGDGEELRPDGLDPRAPEDDGLGETHEVA